ncbi:MAG: phosphate-starvation-inducible PsiE family protein [Cyanobacteriota bacterium ELA615]|jgi:hypothetical protein
MVFRNILRIIKDIWSDKYFLENIHRLEKLIAKTLSIGLIFVVFTSVVELFKTLINEIIVNHSDSFFKEDMFYILGLFLNILIILEVLENITIYLKNQAFALELVIATALIALARKIIIYDIKTSGANELLGVSGSLLALSISYWLIKKNNK